MSLSLDEVKRIAWLARIETSEMQRVDTAGVEPMPHAQDMMLRLREDVVTEADQHLLFQSVAPQVEGGLYLVPKVIE